MTIQACERPVLFEHFEPGSLMGEYSETYSPALAQRWQAIFGDTEAAGAGGPAEQAGMAVVMMMRAYLNVVAPRPPGNIHARQKVQLHGLPRPGETVRAAVRCMSKSMRRERRYIELRVEGSGENGRPLFAGDLTLIWAA
jgi:acyl dehydratase